ncbi:MAG: leucine-rich repeat domain-containing protein [Sedimentisphaerales bacterium]
MEEPSETVKDIKKKSTHRKYIIPAVGILLLIAASLVFIYFTQGQKSDPASEKIIRQAAARQINKDPNKLTEEDFAGITEFRLMDIIPAGRGPGGVELIRYKIIDLSDIRILENFTNLQKLELIAVRYPRQSMIDEVLSKLGLKNFSQRRFLDLSPLNKLSSLQSLNLTEAQLYDTKVLSGLINLQELNISLTQVSDLTGIETLTKLKILNASYTRISDLEPIKNMTNLQRLDLTNCANITNEQVEDLQKSLPNLKIVKLK